MIKQFPDINSYQISDFSKTSRHVYSALVYGILETIETAKTFFMIILSELKKHVVFERPQCPLYTPKMSNSLISE